MRNILQNHPIAAGALTLVVLAVTVYYVLSASRPVTEVPQRAYYFDVGTGELFAHAIDAPFEVSAPSGKAGVRAYVFSCGRCRPEEWRVAYLKRRTAEAAEAIAAATAEPANEQLQSKAAELGDQGTYIAAAPAPSGEVAWLPASSPPAVQLMQEAMALCGKDGRPAPCFPPNAGQ